MYNDIFFKKLNVFNSYNGYCIKLKKLKLSFWFMYNFRTYIYNNLNIFRLYVIICKDVI